MWTATGSDPEISSPYIMLSHTFNGHESWVHCAQIFWDHVKTSMCSFKSTASCNDFSLMMFGLGPKLKFLPSLCPFLYIHTLPQFIKGLCRVYMMCGSLQNRSKTFRDLIWNREVIAIMLLLAFMSRLTKSDIEIMFWQLHACTSDRISHMRSWWTDLHYGWIIMTIKWFKL